MPPAQASMLVAPSPNLRSAALAWTIWLRGSRATSNMGLLREELPNCRRVLSRVAGCPSQGPVLGAGIACELGRRGVGRWLGPGHAMRLRREPPPHGAIPEPLRQVAVLVER